MRSNTDPSLRWSALIATMIRAHWSKKKQGQTKKPCFFEEGKQAVFSVTRLIQGKFPDKFLLPSGFASKE